MHVGLTTKASVRILKPAKREESMWLQNDRLEALRLIVEKLVRLEALADGDECRELWIRIRAAKREAEAEIARMTCKLH
jgi:hypothetical protein